MSLKNYTTPLCSRRCFLSQYVGPTIASLGITQAQTHNPTGISSDASSSSVALRLRKEFRNTYLLATSPDGTLLCLYSTQHPQDSFAWKGGALHYDGSVGDDKDTLRVIEFGSWKTVYTAQLRQKALHASFSEDNGHLYAETLALPDEGFRVRQNAWIDLRSGGLDQRLLAVDDPKGATTYYAALRDSVLLGTEIDGQTESCIGLIRATLPDYKEIAYTPFGPARERESIGHDTDVVISADRKTLTYGTDHTIVSRHAETLEMAWTRQIEPEYFGVVRMAVSANGSRVAAAVLDTTFIEQQRHYYVGVFEGKDGTLVSKLPLNGGEGIAISPDGRFLAVGERLGGAKEAQLAVSIIEVASRQQIAKVIHDQFRVGEGEWVNSHFGVDGLQFSSDGKYLITSSTMTKVWEIVKS